MLTNLSRRARAPMLLGAALVVALAVAAIAATNATPPTKKGSSGTNEPAPAPPRVQDTKANLQLAFDQEMNGKERYLAEAKKADAEGYPAVARLFRACARAEEAHAQRHVEAISAAGGYEARTMLKRFEPATTAENLGGSIERERYEVEQFYPPLIEKARVDGATQAVRSMTYALSAEREHLALLSAAQEDLGRANASQRFYVCPTCGKTVERLGFEKCPNCFTAAKKFVSI